MTLTLGNKHPVITAAIIYIAIHILFYFSSSFINWEQLAKRVEYKITKGIDYRYFGGEAGVGAGAGAGVGAGAGAGVGAGAGAPTGDGFLVRGATLKCSGATCWINNGYGAAGAGGM